MKIIRNLLLSATIALCGSVLPAGAQEDAGQTTADVPVVKLDNGVLMPRFGLGTFMQGSDEVCRQSCLTALQAGYRHIDTAHAYDDERGVGQAVKEMRNVSPYARRRKPTAYRWNAGSPWAVP